MSNPFLNNQFGQASPNFSQQRQQPLQQQQQQLNRIRRAPRLPSQPVFGGPRPVKTMRDLAQEATVTAYRTRFEAGRSFDLDDDFEFCPVLLTDDDYQSVSSASSDRSSLSSGSPELSPTLLHSQPLHNIPSFTTFNPSAAFFQSSSTHAQDLTTGRQTNNNGAAGRYPPKAPSPPASISPSRMHQGYGRRWA